MLCCKSLFAVINVWAFVLPERWYVSFFPVTSTVHDIQAFSMSIKLLYYEWKKKKTVT